MATFATLNPSDKSANITLSNGNLTASSSTTSWSSVRSTIGKSSGKWYWEFTTSDAGDGFMVGIGNSSASLSNFPGADTNGWGYFGATGHTYYNNINTAYGATFANGDVIGVALDMDAGTLVYYKNGVSQGTAQTGLTGTIYADTGLSITGTNSFTMNFGATAFSYSVPTGYNRGLYTGSLSNNNFLAFM